MQKSPFAWIAETDLAGAFAGPPRTWLVTGAAGFIGSHLVQTLLHLGQDVRGLDNFATGHQRNIDQAVSTAGIHAERFHFIDGDIRDLATCEAACEGVEIVLHQAALGSVPRSIADPVITNAVNVGGFLNMLDSARRTGAKRFIYAASSSTYGDEPNLPKREDRIGRPLSPYAVTKLVDELYAEVYVRSYGFAATGLRYFNVFGPRQDPNGAYAAVIPKWTAAMIAGETVAINGDGQTSRDFCYVANAVQANLRAALADAHHQGQVYNVAVGERTNLIELVQLIRESLAQHQIRYALEPEFRADRPGDVKHSQADIAKVAGLGYRPTHRIADGINDAVAFYVDAERRGILNNGGLGA